MPYPRTKSKYTIEQNQMWTVAAMGVLAESSEALTNEQIRLSDLELVNVTSQKMARVLNELCEAGFVVKTKSKGGLVLYKAVSVLIEQGYDMDRMVY